MVAVVIVVIVAAGILAVRLWMSPPMSSQNIQIDRVSLDQVSAPAGSSFYLIELNASNLGTTAWRFNSGFLQATSNVSRVYSAVSGYNVTSLMGESSIQPRNHVVGHVAFEMPNNEIPLRLRYSDPGSGINLDGGSIPQPSVVASRFAYNVHLAVNGLSVDGWTANGCPATTINGTGPWVCSLIINGVIENNSLVFFTGQTVQVNLWFEYLKKPADPATVNFQSVAAENGFAMISVDRPVPFTMTGWASQAGLVLLLRVPAGQQSGNIDLSVKFSA